MIDSGVPWRDADSFVVVSSGGESAVSGLSRSGSEVFVSVGAEVDGVTEDDEGHGLPPLSASVAPPGVEGHGSGDSEGGSSENDVDADGEGWLTGGVVFLSFPPVSPLGRVNQSSRSGS